MSAKLVVDQLRAMRVIPVLRLASRKEADAAVECLIEAGYRTAEITMTVPDALSIIADLRRHTSGDFLVGAGTVWDLDSARACLRAGADYLVSPGFVPGMASVTHAAQRPYLAGAFTPSEVHAARSDGADIIKIFPASSGGAKHLAALRAVFPEVTFCPTGGVSLDNLREYLAAGAAMVGVGNNILDLNALARGDRQVVTAHARQFLDAANR